MEYARDDEAFVYADPPYLGKGDHLYLDTLQWDDHIRLASRLRRGGRWLVAYDADPRVHDELYGGLRCAEFSMRHSAAVQHVGQEYAVFVPGLEVSTLSGLGETSARFTSAR